MVNMIVCDLENLPPTISLYKFGGEGFGALDALGFPYK